VTLARAGGGGCRGDGGGVGVLSLWLSSVPSLSSSSSLS
jgi:hypothetical protein